MTQLFDQMTAPDPAPLPRPARVRPEPAGPVSTPDADALDLSRFFSRPSPRRDRAPRTPPGAWLRAKAPGLGLVVAGALLGVAVARL